MGVDARMFAVVERQLTETELKILSGKLFATIGKEPFWIDKKSNQHTLSFGKFEEATFDHDGPCGTLLEVNLIGRFYGKGYERGNWPIYRLIAEWLEINLNAKVYYGSDSSDYFELLDESKRKEYTDYFLRIGHEPYRSYSLGDEKEIPTCDFCGGKQMHDVGGGGDKTFWHCDGCNTKIITSPNARIVLEENQNFF